MYIKKQYKTFLSTHVDEFENVEISINLQDSPESDIGWIIIAPGTTSEETCFFHRSVGNTVFDAGSIFTVALVDIDKVCLRGLSFGVTDDSDYNEYLKRTHDEIGNNFKIRPKQSCINIYRDYMKLVATFGAEMSKNKSKTLRTLAFTIDSQHKTDIKSKGIIVDRNYNFAKAYYNGTALLEFFNNFVKEVLEIQKEAKENTRKQSSLLNPTYEKLDNHKANILV